MLAVPAFIAAAAFAFGSIFLSSASADPIMEGYYPPAEVCVKLGTSKPGLLRKTPANRQCPQWNIDIEWSTTDDYTSFVDKLTEIEAVTLEWDKYWQDSMSFPDPPIRLVRQRGLAPSRIQKDQMAGNSEFRLEKTSGKIEGWTDALLSLYVKEFKVKPSKEFLDFVNSFDLESMKEELEMAKKEEEKKKAEKAEESR